MEGMFENLYCWFNSLFLNDIERCIQNEEYDLSHLELIKQREKALESIGEMSPYLKEKIDNSYSKMDFSLIEKNEVIENVKSNLTIEMKKISAVMIVFNEERCIQRCIDSIVARVDEIVIVDTGSTDDTVNIVKKINSEKIKMFFYKWNNDFSEARNFAMEKAENDWIFFVDADEYIHNSYNTDIKMLFNSFNNMPEINSIAMCPSILDVNEHVCIGVKRIFQKNSGISFYGKVHEQPRKDVSKLGEDVYYIALGIDIRHDGYTHETMIAKDKANRNYNLVIEMKNLECDNPRWTYFLTRDSLDIIGYKKAETMLKESILKKINGRFEEGNIKFHEYTFSLLDILAGIKLNKGEDEELKDIIILLNTLIPNNSNAFYYNTMSKVNQMKQEMKNLLLESIKYRKNNYEDQLSMLHTKGYHIDFLIGMLLFELSDYKKAFKYFDFLEGKFIIEPIVNKYKKVLEINSCDIKN